MGKWLGILLAIMIACAVVGILVDAVRAIAGLAFFVCLGVIVWQLMTKKTPPAGPA
jgi:hypothetical protein